MTVVKLATKTATGEPLEPPRRWRLPNRRQTRRVVIVYQDAKFRALAPTESTECFGKGELYFVDIGYVNGRAWECFADGPRSGSQIEALIDDAAVAISRELQYGHSPEFLRGGYGRQSDGSPASIFGAILEAIIADAPLAAEEWEAFAPYQETLDRIIWRAKVPQL